MLVRVTVTPDARKERYVVSGDQCAISVKEPAEGNAANTRVREILAYHYQVPLQWVRIISGHHSPRKVIEVRGK